MKKNKENIILQKTDELYKFYFLDDWEMKIGLSVNSFHINRLEDVIGDLNFPIPSHRKTAFDFIFLTKGLSKRAKGLNEYEFSKNTFFFLPAYQFTSHEFLTPDSEGFFCHFQPQIFDDVFPHHTFFEDFNFLNFSGDPIVSVDEEKTAYFLVLLRRLEELYLNNNQTDLKLISLLLVTIFKELEYAARSQNKEVCNRAYMLTKKFKDLLSKHIFETKKVGDYADMLLVSSDYLNRCVKTTTGKTAKDVVADMIILEAIEMLKQTNSNVNEIAFKFAESNPSDFIRLFKKKTSKTPKKYIQ